MQALAIGYFFLLAALAGLLVERAYRLQAEYRQSWLPAYTLYLACWSALALLSVVQYVLASLFLPGSVLQSLQVATSPLWATALAIALYFLSSFMAQLAGGRLPTAYTILYAVAWSGAALVIALAWQQGKGGAVAPAVAASIVMFVLKTATTYGWIAYALVAVRRIDDGFERNGLRRFVLLFLAGCLAFDLAVRDMTAVFGVHTTDAVIGLVQVVMNYPALLWLRHFLRRRAIARPAGPLPADTKEHLGALGLSAREADVIELLLAGLSQKEIADRLCIAPETVKKHTYNAYRKLGVRNRVQLIYLVQNRGPARPV